MRKSIQLDKTIGGIRFAATVPIAGTKVPSAEARYLIAFEREIARTLCARGKPTADGFKFLRERSRIKAGELADLIDVKPETISRWENEHNAVPGAAWELIVILAAERLAGQTLMLDQLRERRRSREHSSDVQHIDVLKLAS